MKFYYDYEICKECGGRCCKRLPGTCHPSDIRKLFPAKTLKKSVLLALNSNNFCVDWWEGKNRKPFIRPATKYKIGVRYDPSWGGECVFLTDNGCKLPEENRPTACKKLEPRKNGGCIPHYKEGNKLAVARMWQKTGIDLFKF